MLGKGSENLFLQWLSFAAPLAHAPMTKNLLLWYLSPEIDCLSTSTSAKELLGFHEKNPKCKRRKIQQVPQETDSFVDTQFEVPSSAGWHSGSYARSMHVQTQHTVDGKTNTEYPNTGSVWQIKKFTDNYFSRLGDQI